MNVKDMTPEQIAEITRYKLRGELSCHGCKFLYSHSFGYSNYTVEGANIECALDLNPNLPKEEPYDWRIVDGKDNWPATANSRCHRYDPSDYMQSLDVDGENAVDHPDYEARRAISDHSGRRMEE